MGDVSRRDFVKAAVVASAGAAIGTGALAGVLPILGDPRPAWTPTPIVRRDRATSALTPVRLADLAGEPVVVHTAEWMYRPAILYKVRKATLEASAAVRGYNTGQWALQHPDEAANAVLAYDGKCTHLGCTVGYNKTLGASKDIPSYEPGLMPGRVLCPCHQAQFDVFDLARNVPGTPGPRPLDAIPIRWGPERDGSPTIEGLRRIRQDRYREADLQGLGKPFRLAGS
jgi:Rieske Fe-S protein